MPTSPLPYPALLRLSVRRADLGHLLIACAVLSSGIVFSEPAVADVLMLGAIIGLPILGGLRLGTVTCLNLALWLAVVALGIIGCFFAPILDTAIKHQLITLFLVIGTITIAAYISVDPESRFNLVMWCYVAACVLATIPAIIGYFRVTPAAFELFTIFGRAKGTFKDPNVYGAALVPALIYVGWMLLRAPARQALIIAPLGALLAIGLVLSFSRGAWISAALAAVLLTYMTLIRSRRQTDFARFYLVVFAAVAAIFLACFILLQFEQVRNLMLERFSFQQSYDVGPEGRFGGQNKAIGLILEHPFGIGTQAFRTLHHHEEAHNVYLTTFLNAGWLGGLLYIVTVFATIAVGLRMSMINSAIQGPMIVATASFVAVAFEGIIIDTDHWRSFFLVMGCVWGLADAPRPHINPASRRDDPPGFRAG